MSACSYLYGTLFTLECSLARGEGLTYDIYVGSATAAFYQVPVWPESFDTVMLLLGLAFICAVFLALRGDGTRRW